ncbi:MAG TPA: hypothetical protein VFX05_18580 [Casimicrobiaceae bacterium]|nr:hypothetical protein [Casimicrobiaceae bacterium]
MTAVAREFTEAGGSAGQGVAGAGASRWWVRSEAGLRALIVAAAVLHVLVPVAVFFARFRHAYENSWLEGLVLEHVRRIGEGRPVFAAPSFDFVALIYTPLYYYAGALLGAASGEGYATLRALSMACSVASMAIVGLFVRRETGSVLCAVASAGLFAATYKMNGFWFDLARVDNMMLALLLAGLYLVRFGASTVAALAAGLLFGAALLTKQTALAVVAPAVLWAIVRAPRHGVVLAMSTLAIVGAAAALWEIATDGWFGYYVFTLPSRHAIGPAMLFHAVTDLLPLPLAVGFLLGAYFLIWSWRERGAATTAFYLLVAAGAVIGSASSLAKWLAYLNALMPAHAVVSILFGLGFHALLRDAAASGGAHAQRLRLVATLAVFWQLAALFYNPLAALPQAERTQRTSAMIDAIRTIDGDVFFPIMPHLLPRAGKPGHANEMQIADVLAHDAGEARAGLLRDIERTAASGRIAVVIARPEGGFLPAPAYWQAFATRYRESAGTIPAELLSVGPASDQPNRVFVRASAAR